MSEFFLQRYKAICPDVTMDVIPKQALRVNTIKIPESDLVEKMKDVLLTKIPWLLHGYYTDAEFSLGSTKEYLLGWYYLQSPLSQLACEVLDPKGDVLDMAAAPGGKTTYLAQMVPDATIVALDENAIRLESVRNNVERLGLPNVICVKKDARFASDLKKQFKFVLLDAPCSGNFCSEPNWAAKRSIPDIQANARTQKELLKAAYACLAPGGKLLYSTCSLEPEENEMMIDWFIDKYDDLSVKQFYSEIGDNGITEWNGKKLDDSLMHTKRFWPHKTGCEGFFIALIQRQK